jgi:hypothetical protein
MEADNEIGIRRKGVATRSNMVCLFLVLAQSGLLLQIAT